MKNIRFIVQFAIVLIIPSIHAHPTFYPDVNIAQLEAKGIWPPPFRSYHIHCVFQAYDADIKTHAVALKQKFIEHFNLANVRMCEGLYDQGRLCMFETEASHGKSDPFVSGDWAAFIPLEYFNSTVPWIMQNRGDLDILVHPNSGAKKHDHSKWCLWGGHIWPINMSAFDTPNATRADHG